MKTAISIPDRVFKGADKAARKLGMSRSEFYARAIQAYLDAFQSEGVTDALNLVYARESSKLDPAVARMQRASVPRERW